MMKACVVPLIIAKLGWLLSAPVLSIAITFRCSRSMMLVFPACLWTAQSRRPSADTVMSEEKMSANPVMVSTTVCDWTSIILTVGDSGNGQLIRFLDDLELESTKSGSASIQNIVSKKKATHVCDLHMQVCHLD